MNAGCTDAPPPHPYPPPSASSWLFESLITAHHRASRKLRTALTHNADRTASSRRSPGSGSQWRRYTAAEHLTSSRGAASRQGEKRHTQFNLLMPRQWQTTLSFKGRSFKQDWVIFNWMYVFCGSNFVLMYDIFFEWNSQLTLVLYYNAFLKFWTVLLTQNNNFRSFRSEGSLYNNNHYDGDDVVIKGCQQSLN